MDQHPLATSLLRESAADEFLKTLSNLPAPPAPVRLHAPIARVNLRGPGCVIGETEIRRARSFNSVHIRHGYSVVSASANAESNHEEDPFAPPQSGGFSVVLWTGIDCISLGGNLIRTEFECEAAAGEGQVIWLGTPPSGTVCRLTFDCPAGPLLANSQRVFQWPDG
jgi:hypothetical protein